MTENTNMSEVIAEIQGASEEELRGVIEHHFEEVRAQGMKVGATYLAAAVYSALKKNLKKGTQSSLRDHQRATKSVLDIVSVQLTQQNDSSATETYDAVTE